MILCCNVIDRWDWRRKVTGALEVTVELWDRLGWLGGLGLGWWGWGGVAASSADCWRSHDAIHTNRLMHSLVDSQHTWMHLHKTQISTCREPMSSRLLSARATFDRGLRSHATG